MVGSVLGGYTSEALTVLYTVYFHKGIIKNGVTILGMGYGVLGMGFWVWGMGFWAISI